MVVEHAKMALPISQFKYMPMYKALVDSTLNTTGLLGHNRHATKGASDNHAYAHPFQHEHINLMHNGSLTSHHALTTETFVVDSEAICRALVDTPIEELVPKLRGAFALVWVDSKQQTLNFVRNDERPLALAYNLTRNTIYWASERDMLHWLLNREGLTTNKVSYDNIIELPIGEVWSFPLTKNSVNIADVTKTKVELAEAYSYTQYQRGGGYGTTVGKPRQGQAATTTPTKTTTNTSTPLSMAVSVVKQGLDVETAKFRHNNVTEQALVKVCRESIEKQGRACTGFRTFVANIDQKSLTELEGRIGVYVESFQPYKGNVQSDAGEVKGVMLEYPFSKVTLHAVKKTDYDQYVLNDRLVTGYFAAATLPQTLKYRHSLSAEEMAEVDINIKFGTICLLPNITDWECTQHPKAEVRALHTKESTALLSSALIVKK